MVDNFAYLINTFGYIPNGNRSYFLGRSQPPFFSLMVNLVGSQAVVDYLPELEKEYQFWMEGEDLLDSKTEALNRVVRLSDGSILNRYWDRNNSPRPEAYKEDVELSHQSLQQPEELFRNLRAAAESGWDFSSRWFKDGINFNTIHTTEIIPIDLNCLLLNLEQTLEHAWKLSKHIEKSEKYKIKAFNRLQALYKYCWNKERKFFFDFDFRAGKQKEMLTLAATFPLFFGIASKEQAACIANTLEKSFLKPSGITTTLFQSGQQWDAPNGWAPLQWITIVGLKNYGFHGLASAAKTNWINVIDKVYAASAKMTEKYDVWGLHGEAKGGEYPNQDGFGWTNGVYLALQNA